MTDTPEATPLPLDPAAVATLAERGLDFRPASLEGEAGAAFIRAVGSGFLEERLSDERVDGMRQAMASWRAAGVYDPASANPLSPVGTIGVQLLELTVEPGRTLPLHAISEVTVAGTHRRRGIARAMLTGELRAAKAAGTPIAGLTVSEATIYGRYGFSPATTLGHWTIDTRRVQLTGERPTGRYDAIEREQALADVQRLHDLARRGRPGEVSAWPECWKNALGLQPGAKDVDKTRVVRYTDAAGAVRGLLTYTLQGDDRDYAHHTLRVQHLLTDGAEGYAAIWRFILEHDLTTTVKTWNMAPDEPLLWMVADQRGIQREEMDHHWLRILDVPTVLGARRYRVPGVVRLRVGDPLDLAAGEWLFRVAPDGAAHLEQVGSPGSGGVQAGESEGEAADGATTLSLDVAALSSLLLGGVRASTLRAAGRIETDQDTAQWLDATFAPLVPPLLSIWY